MAAKLYPSPETQNSTEALSINYPVIGEVALGGELMEAQLCSNSVRDFISSHMPDVFGEDPPSRHLQGSASYLIAQNWLKQKQETIEDSQTMVSVLLPLFEAVDVTDLPQTTNEFMKLRAQYGPKIRHVDTTYSLMAIMQGRLALTRNNPDEELGGRFTDRQVDRLLGILHRQPHTAWMAKYPPLPPQPREQVRAQNTNLPETKLRLVA